MARHELQHASWAGHVRGPSCWRCDDDLEEHEHDTTIHDDHFKDDYDHDIRELGADQPSHRQLDKLHIVL
jgi:hypothetical protein